MLIIYNKVLPFPGYRAINLFGIIFARENELLPERTVTHELIHTQQMRETLFIGFYVWYLLEFLIKLVICFNWDRAYRSVSFEQEAYMYDTYPHWLRIRPMCTWHKFVFKLINK